MTPGLPAPSNGQDASGSKSPLELAQRDVRQADVPGQHESRIKCPIAASGSAQHQTEHAGDDLHALAKGRPAETVPQKGDASKGIAAQSARSKDAGPKSAAQAPSAAPSRRSGGVESSQRHPVATSLPSTTSSQRDKASKALGEASAKETPDTDAARAHTNGRQPAKETPGTHGADADSNGRQSAKHVQKPAANARPAATAKPQTASPDETHGRQAASHEQSGAARTKPSAPSPGRANGRQPSEHMHKGAAKAKPSRAFLEQTDGRQSKNHVQMEAAVAKPLTASSPAAEQPSLGKKASSEISIIVLDDDSDSAAESPDSRWGLRRLVCYAMAKWSGGQHVKKERGQIGFKDNAFKFKIDCKLQEGFYCSDSHGA